jgi:peptide/nickel transport system substrate-binding protein
MMMGWKQTVLAATAVVSLGWGSAVMAQDLSLALSAEPSAMDPHYHNLTPNNALARHIFEPLVAFDSRQTPTPGLAESWRVVDDKTWEFKLRKGVKFHDGSDFTAEDVVFTFQRAPAVPNSPSSFAAYIRGRTVEVVDPHTILVRTAAPDPLILRHFAQFGIVSAKAGKDARTEDYNSGKAAIGTGPFRFVQFTPGDRVVMQRNDAYWGTKPDWAKVTFRFIKSDPTRVAALLSGDVDVIETVPTADAARLKSDPKLSVASELSNRVIYFHMDQFRETSPFITAKDGSKIKNPLRDARVRRAFSMALNRPAIVSRIMENEAQPAGQFLPETFFGTSKKLKPVAFDLEGAKKLLAEAGYPNGFKMTMHGPIGRYTNDTKIIEAAAQMFTRLGIETAVEGVPAANFFTRASGGGANDAGEKGFPEFSFILVGWSAGTGEASDSLKALVGSFNREKGTGAANRGRYSNPKVDEMIAQAVITVDDAKRAALLAEATEIAINDTAIIPIHYPMNSWAVRAGFTIEPRADEYTLATSVKKK